MKKITNALKFTCILVAFSLAIVACDSEFSTIESDVLSEENFNFNTQVDSSTTVIAYNKPILAQQINGLPSNLLGFYKDPNYGSTTASIVTQVLPNRFNPVFGADKRIDSVFLTIPYFSTQTGINSTTGAPTFELDSIFTRNNDTIVKPIKLKVYENKFFLRDFNLEEAGVQNYYSVPNATSNTAQTEFETINFEEQKDFLICDTILKPSTENISIFDNGVIDTPESRPALRLNLAANSDAKDFWEAVILFQEGAASLSNANAFLNHFRGLYITAEAENDEGSMILVNLLDAGANIILYYSTDDNNDGERELGTYTLNFRGNILNTFINNYLPDAIPEEGDPENGDDKLFIKGTQGSIAVIELFNDDADKTIECNCGKDSSGQDIIKQETELNCFKKTYRKTDDNGNELPTVNGQFELKRLLNEAHLTVYEDDVISDNEVLNGGNRLYLYDIETGQPVLDFQSDPTANTTTPFLSRLFSLGRRQSDNRGIKYKIKLTDHLINILVRDADSPKLGIAVSNNVNLINSSSLLNTDYALPLTATIAPRGTILIGNGDTNSLDKKIKLRLFYTESN